MHSTGMVSLPKDLVDHRVDPARPRTPPKRMPQQSQVQVQPFGFQSLSSFGRKDQERIQILQGIEILGGGKEPNQFRQRHEVDQ